MKGSLNVTTAFIRTIAGAALVAAAMAASIAAQTTSKMAADIPKEGQKAPDFSLTAIDGTTVRLSDEIGRGPTVLVVLRGWPGYQCPFCTRQFGEYLTKSSDIEVTGARVLFVYPGPEQGLKEHAEAFVKSRPLPSSYRVLLDPDYAFTNAYGLRWNAPNETAYPSTFVLDTRGTITFARTSRAHGDRVPVADVLKALAPMTR